jgi:hypothetical protein
MASVNSIASDYTAQLLAELPDPVPTPERAPGDFGRDTLCFDTLKTGRYMSGKLLVASGIYRWLLTPPGILSGSDADRNWGFGIQKYLGRVTTESERAQIGGDIETGLLEDDRRLDSVSAIVTQQIDGAGDVELTIAIAATSAAGPLQFKVAVDQVSARFLGLEGA